MTTERSALLTVLRALPGVLFIEPSRELYMQDEVHDRGRALRSERGLSAAHPYIGWHAQAEAFTAKGSLSGGQRVYFGGDRAVVAEALRAVESAGFAVLGGRTEHEAFEVRRDAFPVSAEISQQTQWKVRLAVLGSDLVAPLREGEERMLHDIVAADEWAVLHPETLRALRLRGMLTGADLDLAFTPDTLAALERAKRPGGSASELTEIILAAFSAGYPEAAKITAGLAREGRADAAMLSAWGGPEARQAAFDYLIATGDGANVYLDLVRDTGGDPVLAAVAAAEKQHEADGDQPGASVIAALVKCYGGLTRAHALQALRDERIPLWLRVRVGDHFSRAPLSPQEADAIRAEDATVSIDGMAGEVVDDDTVREWPREVDALRVAAGLPPGPGFDLHRDGVHRAVIENRDYMLETHRDGLVAAVLREDLEEPTLAVLLELLVPADVLPAEALDALASRWRTLFVRPGPYTPAPPALLTVAMACVWAGHPMGEKIVAAVRGDKRKWTEPLKMALMGALDEGPEADAAAVEFLEAKAFSGDDGSGDARWALVAIRARQEDTQPVVVAAEHVLSSPERPAYIARGFAHMMVAMLEPGSAALWHHYFRDWSTTALQSALALANARLPEEVRRVIVAVAEGTNVLEYPERAAVQPHPELVAELATQLAGARETREQ